MMKPIKKIIKNMFAHFIFELSDLPSPPPQQKCIVYKRIMSHLHFLNLIFYKLAHKCKFTNSENHCSKINLFTGCEES